MEEKTAESKGPDLTLGIAVDDLADGGMACESELIIENAPRSCRMSSAAMVSRRMRDSANATSSAIAGSR